MKKNLLNPLRALALFTAVIALVFTTSCGDDEDPDCDELTWYADADGDGLGDAETSVMACEQPEGYVDNSDDDDDTQAEPTSNLWELVESTEGLDSLEKYLGVYPDLVATLEAEGTFTLFAPDNNAFIGLLQTPGFPQNIASINPDIIKNVLAYHVSVTLYESSDLTAGTQVATASAGNELIIVNEDGTLKTGSTNQNIEIKTADRAATNGVMHIVGSVMIPPTVGQTLTPILGTNAGTLLLGADFSILAQAILKADTFATGAGLPTLASILSADASEDATKLNTVFAPSNATFEVLADSLFGDNNDEATEAEINSFLGFYSGQQFYGIVANHVIVGQTLGVSDLSTGASFATAASSAAQAQMLTFYQIEGAGDFTDVFIDSNGDFNPTEGTGLNAEVALPNAADSGNGTVHVIAGLLTPIQ